MEGEENEKIRMSFPLRSFFPSFYWHMWWIFAKVSFIFKSPQPFFLGENILNMEKSHFSFTSFWRVFLAMSSVYQLELPSWSLESIFVSGSLHNSCPFLQE